VEIVLKITSSWSETVVLSIKATRQKRNEDCIIILLPCLPDYGTTDFQTLKKEREFGKSIKKSTSTYDSYIV